jgi:hypothetical protein
LKALLKKRIAEAEAGDLDARGITEIAETVLSSATPGE